MPQFLTHPIFIVSVLALIIQLLAYLVVFRKLAVHRPQEFDGNEKELPAVSVVIAAKNEERNLRQFLPVILEQEYHDFEVIVIDDQSEDGTADLLKEMQQQYRHLRVVKIEDHVREFAGKKLALTLGFKAAKNDILLLTDADCVPETPYWILNMAAAYEDDDVQIVLGVSPYKPKANLLNAFIRFDTFYTALQYVSLALIGLPYMGVGRNLSYRKSFFFSSKGFAPYMKVISGDDDLFVNRHATAKNTRVQLHPDSFIRSKPKKTLRRWLWQKRRHLQTGKLYKRDHKRMIGLVWMANLYFYWAVIACIILVKPFWLGLAILGVRMLVQLIIFYQCLRKLKMASIWPLVPVFDVLYQLLYLPVMGALGVFSKPKKGW